MKLKKLLFFTFLALPLLGFSQDEDRFSIPDTIPFTIDSLYREDQFYVGFSFNLVTNKPDDISQESFSGGLNLGFIRDFPINERRNMAIGIGAGWAIDSYGQNLRIGEQVSGKTQFTALGDDADYSTNRFTTQQIEAPIEFRWRTSTPQTYKFWRIYTGLRLGYIYHFRSNFNDNTGQLILNDLPELNRFRAGATFTFGYNTFNFQFYYSLIPFFKDAMLNNEQLEVSTLKIGLTFYIL